MQLRVRVKDLTVGETGRSLIDEGCFDIEGPGLRVITGESGSGKTTLLHLMAGLIGPTGQSVFEINGLPATGYRQRRVIPQRPNLMLDRSLIDNVRIPMQFARSDSGRLPEQTVRLFGLWSARNTIARLASGGEQTRTVLAREYALADPGSVVFADEPTAALDAASRASVYEVLEQMAVHLPVIAVAHDDQARNYACGMIEIAGRRVIHRPTEATQS
jgi:ABC-type lipoprotein export system ATPase subunit